MKFTYNNHEGFDSLFQIEKELRKVRYLKDESKTIFTANSARLYIAGENRDIKNRN